MGYRTIAKAVTASFIEKKSEFIAALKPVQTADEAIAFIDEIRRANRKARHNVYAYIVRENNTTRYSDDGEPQGTAGVPVLNVLQKNQLTDVCCVVTRYFGGILLGGGGLVRAYSHSAALAVEAADIQVMEACYPITLQTAYSLYGKIAYQLPQLPILQKDAVFGDTVTLSLLVPEALADAFRKDMVELTNGDIQIQTGNLQHADFAEVADRFGV